MTRPLVVPSIEEVWFLGGPYYSGTRNLSMFGAAVYEFRVPGILCSQHDIDRQHWASGFSRFFGEIPRNWRSALDSYKGAGRRYGSVRYDVYHVTVSELEGVFGPRRPTVEDPEGYPVVPGSQAGEVCLFFECEPIHDIIWPQWGVWCFVSQRVKDLFEENEVTGVRYHPAAGARVVGRNTFRKLVKHWRWAYEQFRDNVPSNAGRPADTTFYEIEVVGKRADCGLRWREICPYCGRPAGHDLTQALTSGPIQGFPCQDFFNIQGMGRPVCTQHVIDILKSSRIQSIDLTNLSDFLAHWVQDDESG